MIQLESGNNVNNFQLSIRIILREPGAPHTLWVPTNLRNGTERLIPPNTYFAEPVTGILVLKILVPGPIFSLKILVPWTNFF